MLVARDPTTFLAGWELMTLVPAAAILVARARRRGRRAVFVYLAITHLGGVGVWVALLLLADHGALGDAAARRAGGAAQALVIVARAGRVRHQGRPGAAARLAAARPSAWRRATSRR